MKAGKESDLRDDDELLDTFERAQSELVVQTSDLPLGTLSDMVDSAAIDLEPGFQRRERWSIDKQSALIESFLMNIPVPPIYLSEEKAGTYTAIDGKQRLRAITDFIKGRFSLRNLESLTVAEGKSYPELPIEIKNALNLKPYLRVVTLLKQTNALLTYEVFLRLNRGGEKLNNQEIRNVAFRGKLNDAIYKAADNKFLKDRLKISSEKSSAYRNMTDAEYVLRFLVLHDESVQFRGDFARSMDRFMEMNQAVPEDEANQIVEAFSIALTRCERLWGSHAFHRPDGDGWRQQTLAGMYDAQMLSAFQLSAQEYADMLANIQKLLQATRSAFDDPEFEKSIQTGTNTPARIEYRVTKFTEIFRTI